MLKNKKIGVIGAGSWGTAIASVLAYNKLDVMLWGFEQWQVHDLLKFRENKTFLPGYTLSENIYPDISLEKCVKGCMVVCMVVPTHAYRTVFTELIPFLEDGATIVSASKGVENESLKTMSQVMAECIEKSGTTKTFTLAVLSGPSFAKEVAAKMPTAITVGCEDIEVAKQLQETFVTQYFRVYASDDVLGLEICGALKNIIAIAAGICDGLGYGLNTRAALITRGLAEIIRFGSEIGANEKTFSGLSGIGDLLLTCTGDLSRNRTVGFKLGQGKKLQDILDEMKMVAEGVKTTRSAYDLIQQMQIEMPILEQVYKILYEDKECSVAVKDLLSRELKVE